MREQRATCGAGGKVKLSFVIPAYNEEAHVGETIVAIHRAMEQAAYPYEIIVADHGSSDQTREIAARNGAVICSHRGGTVGGLRNVGVQEASGGVIIFLDADIRLTSEWAERLPRALALLDTKPRTLAGSTCGISADPVWIERIWFRPERVRLSHVNSGHLMTTRAFFAELGGFDDSLETGEDYDLSHRARRCGGEIVIDPGLKVTHEGFPRTLVDFVRREMWHGTGDFQSWRTALRSIVALATLAFVLLHLLCLVSLWFGSSRGAALGVAGIALLCALSAFRKMGVGGVLVFMATAGLFYAYYVGRTLALGRALWPWRRIKWMRSGRRAAAAGG